MSLRRRNSNGRQIKDILHTTLLLAMGKDAPSNLEHVQTIKKLGAANVGVLVKNKEEHSGFAVFCTREQDGLNSNTFKETV
jgi:hypothetical protein